MIQKLNQEVAEQICSQQIITNLNQCIKQLVDNSIDAKATVINIKLTDFGKKTIQIYDNGTGISKIQLLGKKGTTSKTSVNPNEEILNNIKFLGFRGEALTSIAKLSKNMTIQTTYVNNQNFQFKSYNMKTMKMIEHKILDPKENPVTNTNVIIQQIFDCLPIRREQLKQRSKQNLREVFNTINQICIVYPQIKFVLSNDNYTGIDLLIQQPNYPSFNQINWRKRIQDCFPGKLQDALVYISDQNIEGFVLNTIDSGSSKKNIKFSKNVSYMYLNRRPITPIKKVHKLFDQIYKKYNSYTKYVYFINLKLHPSCVDINLTPNKRQIFIKLQFMQKIIKQVNSEINQKIIQKIGNLQDFKQKRTIHQEIQPISQKRSKVIQNKQKEDDKTEQKSISKKSLQNIRIQLKKGTKNTQPVLQDKNIKSGMNQSLAQRLRLKMGVIKQHNQAKHKQNQPKQSTVQRIFISELKDDNLNNKLNNSSQHRNQIKQRQQYNQSHCQQQKRIQSQQKQIQKQEDLGADNQCFQIKKQKIIEGYQNDLLGKTKRQLKQQIPCSLQQLQPLKLQIQGHQKQSKKVIINSQNKYESSIQLSKQNSLSSTQKKIKNIQNSQKQFLDVSSKSNQKISNYSNRNQQQHHQINYINQSSPINKEDFVNFYIHGQFNHGFILCSYKKKIYLIDQHAASQKDNFQKLIDTKLGFICQTIITKINSIEADRIQMATGLLRQSGFTYQVNNRTQLKIIKCPTFLKQIFNAEQFMQIVQNNKSLKQLPIFYNSAASRACRSAIMIGDRLNKDQMKKLVNKMSQLKSPWNCPHGRPSLIQLANVSQAANCIRFNRQYSIDEI